MHTMKRLAVVTGMLALVSVTLADVPRLVSYQGRLTGNGDDPVNLRIRFYDAATDGNLLFEETHDAIQRQNGLFTILIGSTHPDGQGVKDEHLATTTGELWLQVSVHDGNEWIELTPRTRLVMVPFAAKATVAEGLVKPGTLQRVVSVDGTNVRIYDDDGSNPAVIGAAEQCGVITLLDQDMNHRIVLDTRQPGFIRTPHLVVDGSMDPSGPTVNIWTHSDYVHPNRTALEVKGGVTDIDPKYFRVYTDGDDPYTLKASLDGRLTTQVLQITGGSDLAEPGHVSDAGLGPDAIQPGMVVSIDPANPGTLMLATEAYDRKVAGVISGAGGVQPGMIMKQEGHPTAEGEHPIAMVGKVYVWADASYGAIEPGDMLTSSRTPGHAMKATDPQQAFGAVIGKAMSPLREDKGLVLALVNLQ